MELPVDEANTSYLEQWTSYFRQLSSPSEISPGKTSVLSVHFHRLNEDISLLVVGYRDGFQVYNLKIMQEIVAKKTNPVHIARVLTCTNEMQALVLHGIITFSYDDNTVSLYTIQNKSTQTISTPSTKVIDICTNSKYIIILSYRQLQIYTHQPELKLIQTLTTNGGDAIALGTRWLAYPNRVQGLQSSSKFHYTVDPSFISPHTKQTDEMQASPSSLSTSLTFTDVAQGMASGIYYLSKVGKDTIAPYIASSLRSSISLDSASSSVGSDQLQSSRKISQSFEDSHGATTTTHANGTSSTVTSAAETNNSTTNSSHHSSGNSSSELGYVTIYDIPTQTPIVCFQAHTAMISTLHFDASGTLLVTSSANGQNLHVYKLFPSYQLQTNHGVKIISAAATAAYQSKPYRATIANQNIILLYKLMRGIRHTKIHQVTVHDSMKWIAVTSMRGTTHFYAIHHDGSPVHGLFHTTLPSNQLKQCTEFMKQQYIFNTLYRTTTGGGGSSSSSANSSNVLGLKLQPLVRLRHFCSIQHSSKHSTGSYLAEFLRDQLKLDQEELYHSESSNNSFHHSHDDDSSYYKDESGLTQLTTSKYGGLNGNAITSSVSKQQPSSVLPLACHWCGKDNTFYTISFNSLKQFTLDHSILWENSNTTISLVSSNLNGNGSSSSNGATSMIINAITGSSTVSNNNSSNGSTNSNSILSKTPKLQSKAQLKRQWNISKPTPFEEVESSNGNCTITNFSSKTRYEIVGIDKTEVKLHTLDAVPLWNHPNVTFRVIKLGATSSIRKANTSQTSKDGKSKIMKTWKDTQKTKTNQNGFVDNGGKDDWKQNSRVLHVRRKGPVPVDTKLLEKLNKEEMFNEDEFYKEKQRLIQGESPIFDGRSLHQEKEPFVPTLDLSESISVALQSNFEYVLSKSSKQIESVEDFSVAQYSGLSNIQETYFAFPSSRSHSCNTTTTNHSNTKPTRKKTQKTKTSNIPKENSEDDMVMVTSEPTLISES